MPFTAGETLIDFRVQGESIVGSPHPVEMPVDPGTPGQRSEAADGAMQMADFCGFLAGLF